MDIKLHEAPNDLDQSGCSLSILGIIFSIMVILHKHSKSKDALLRIIL